MNKRRYEDTFEDEPMRGPAPQVRFVSDTHGNALESKVLTRGSFPSVVFRAPWVLDARRRGWVATRA